MNMLNNPLQVLDTINWMRMHEGVCAHGSAHGCACSGHLLSVYKRLHLYDTYMIDAARESVLRWERAKGTITILLYYLIKNKKHKNYIYKKLI